MATDDIQTLNLELGYKDEWKHAFTRLWFCWKEIYYTLMEGLQWISRHFLIMQEGEKAGQAKRTAWINSKSEGNDVFGKS